jgi:hypothetical protein
MDITFDPSLFASLGINLEANSMDNPKPPVDGGYQIRLKVEKIPTTKKDQSGKEVTNQKLVGGTDYAGESIAPQGDAASLKTDDQGRANYTLHTTAEILNDAGRTIRKSPTYITTNMRNGTSMALDLAKVIEAGSPGAIDFASALTKYNDPGKTPNPVWYGLVEAIKELLEANPEGLVVSGFVTTVLEQNTGKKDANGYDEKKVLARGSDQILAKYPAHWTGDQQPDGFRLETKVKGFKA